jgi:hypothetical protein
MAAGDIFNYSTVNNMANEFLINSLAAEHINAHKGKTIVDVGFLDREIVILFEDMAQMTIDVIGTMGKTTDPSAIVGSKFEDICINNNYSIAEDMFIARVSIYTRHEKKTSMLTVNYKIPLMKTVESKSFPATIHTTYLNEVEQCHATPETTKKNTKPMTEHQQSVQKGQSETKQEDSSPKRAKSTKATEKMSTTLSPFQREAVRAGVISVSEMLQRIGHTQELPTPR